MEIVEMLKVTQGNGGSRIVGKRGSVKVEVCCGYNERPVIEWGEDGSMRGFKMLKDEELIEYMKICEGLVIER